jgi:hypothetical protein
MRRLLDYLGRRLASRGRSQLVYRMLAGALVPGDRARR